MRSLRSPLDGFRSPLGKRAAAGSGGPLGHRFWKITFTESNGGLINFSELEVYDAPYGKNIMHLASFSVSSDYFGNAQSIIGNGVFSSAGERFLFASAVPQSITLDFGEGEAHRVDGIGIHFWQREGDGAKGPKAGTIYWSDDGDEFNEEWSFSGATDWVEYEFRRWSNPNITVNYSGSPHGEHTTWRIFMQDSESNDWLNISEVEFLTGPAGVDQSAGCTATPDLYGGREAIYAIDDDNSTFWTPASPKSPFQIVSPTPIKVGAFSVRSRSELPSQCMKQGILQFTADGTHWTSTMSVKNQTGWTASERRVFTDPAYI